MKKLSLLAGASLTAVPVVALLPGCGGGSSDVVSPTPTNVPTATATVVLTPTVTATVAATPTRTPRPFDTVNPQLAYTASSDANFQPHPLFYGSLDARGSVKSATVLFVLNDSYITFSGSFKNAAQGKIYSPDSTEFLVVPSITNRVGNQTRVFTFQSGSITMSSLGRSGGRITFKDAMFGANGGGAVGKITVNGTISDTFFEPLSEN